MSLVGWLTLVKSLILTFLEYIQAQLVSSQFDRIQADPRLLTGET